MATIFGCEKVIVPRHVTTQLSYDKSISISNNVHQFELNYKSAQFYI